MDTNLVAAQSRYRPQIIVGGYRRNPHPEALKAGWPWASGGWRIWHVEDGILHWQHGSQQHRCTPGMWVIHQADRITSHVMASPGARWGQLRFRLCPDDPGGDPLSEAAWGCSIPPVLSAEQTKTLRPVLTDILAWWWRDDWYLLRAESALASLLVDLAHQWRDQDSHWLHSKQDAFTAADIIWQTRPLAPVAELAAACGMSERSFRRHFQAQRGTTPQRYARTLMATQACDALRDHPEWNVRAIGKHLGYAHPSTFIRAFQTELGTTPDQWRQRHRSRSNLHST
jgi:AraC-like DNA-binding protein